MPMNSCAFPASTLTRSVEALLAVARQRLGF
jgi:hypothetical protein